MERARALVTLFVVGMLFAPLVPALAIEDPTAPSTPNVASVGGPPAGLGDLDPWLDASGDTLFGDLVVGEHALQFSNGALVGSSDSSGLRFAGRDVCLAGDAACGVAGPAGPMGPAGPQGLTGSAGPQGLSGATGPQGATGAQGATGTQGEIGPAGAQGATGPQGLTGAQGDVGPVGAQGATGPQGLTGAQGDVGPVGAQGATGPQGLTGPQGDVGPAGAQGATGPQGLTGPQGDVGPMGPTGATGVQGPQGMQGEIGATGETGPAGANGTQGPQGIPGETGATGAPGEMGPQGLQGIQGLIGETGAPGEMGPQGPQGLRGETGATGSVTPVSCTVGEFMREIQSGGVGICAGAVTSVAGGTGLLGGTITSTGTLSVDPSYVQRRVSGTCVAGAAVSAIAEDGSVTCAAPSADWKLGGNAGTVPDTNFLGTTDNTAFDIKVNGARALRIEPKVKTPNLIGGHYLNQVEPGAYGAVVAGGGYFDEANVVTKSFGVVGGGANNRAAPYAVIAGGSGNRAWGDHSIVGGGGLNNASAGFGTVSGGHNNDAFGSESTTGGGAYNNASGTRSSIGGGGSNWAAGDYSVVPGGYNNTATGTYATVGGGYQNWAGGDRSVVPGGQNNTATAAYTFAAGRNADAAHIGAFVWADSAGARFASTALNQFLIRATGNVGINTNTPDATLTVATGGTGNVRIGAFPCTASYSAISLAEPLGCGTYNLVSSPTDPTLYINRPAGKDIQFREDNGDQMVIKSGGKVGIGTTGPADKLQVAGDIRLGIGTTGCVKDADATVIAGTCSSDARFKKNIRPYGSILDKLAALVPVRFDWRADEFPDKHFGANGSFGLIAQDVEAVMPELVVEDEHGYKAVRYHELPMLLLQGVKDLKAQNDALVDENVALKAQLAEQDARLDRIEAMLLAGGA